MFTWIDGHSLLVFAACPVVATFAIGWLNARTVRRCQQRAGVMSRGGAR